MKTIRIAIALAVFLALAPAPWKPAGAKVAPLNLPDAIAAQHRLIEQSPEDAGLYNDLGNLFYLADRTEEAEDAYREGIRLDPEFIPIRYNLALLLHQSNRPRRAEQEYRWVLKTMPDHAWSHYQLGVLFYERGRRAAAIRSYARSMRLDPRLTDPAFNPHIVENSLASSAILMAYSDLSAAALAPREYENPGHVTAILIQAPDGRGMLEQKIDKSRERKQRRKAKQQDPGN